MKFHIICLMVGSTIFTVGAMEKQLQHSVGDQEFPERSSSDTVLEKRKQMARSATLSTIVLKKSKPLAQIKITRSSKIDKRSTSPRPIPRSKSMATSTKTEHVTEEEYNTMHSPQLRLQKRAAQLLAAQQQALSSSPSSSDSAEADEQNAYADAAVAGE